MTSKFFKCRHCGNVIHKFVDSKVPVFCCGEEMQELIPNTVDAGMEKHLPSVRKLDDGRYEIKVGSDPHPMFPEHHICFIFVECEDGGIYINLKNKKSAEAIVCTSGSKPIAVYEYCNIHGLWKTVL